jgi:hypothetical protein
MQLSYLSLADPLTIRWHTKLSLLQLHVLFLGFLIKPYQDCLLNLGKFRLSYCQIACVAVRWKAIQQAS